MFKFFCRACICCLVSLISTFALAQDNYIFPVLKENNPLRYPDEAIEQGYEGWAYYSFTIGADGKVHSVNILDSNGVDVLDRVLRLNLQDRIYEPASFNGEPVEHVERGLRSVFLITNLPRSAPKLFVRRYKRAISELEKGDLGAVASIIGSMQAVEGRSLYEELYLQSLLVAYSNQLGDTAREHQHLERVTDFIATPDAKYRIVEPDFFVPYLARAYQIETRSMRLGDAFFSASRLNAVAPNDEVTQQVLAHAESLGKKIEGKEFHIKGELLTPLSGGETGDWKTDLLRKAIRLQDVKGDLDSVEIECAKGRMRLGYPAQVQWILPADWGGCMLRIEGSPGSTFTVAEFPERSLPSANGAPQNTAGAS